MGYCRESSQEKVDAQKMLALTAVLIVIISL